METAKVDIRKLQLLNDRINQCIEALNQVRLSVHGLSPSPAGLGYQGFGQIPPTGYGLSHTGALGLNPLFPQMGAFPGQGFGQPGQSPFMQPGQIPFPQPGQVPFPQQGQVPFPQQGQIPFTPGGFPGLSHSSAWGTPPGINPYSSPYGQEQFDPQGRAGLTDPFLTSRIAQTFPYAQYPIPPVVALS